MQVIQSQVGFLDTLKSRDDLYEAQQPTAIRSILKRHQKQALTFMTQRENGWNFDQNFINKVSNTYLTEEPPQFCGGIIADTMGLGKTLTMIALVASDLDNPRGERMATFDRLPGAPEVETSLIIIPPPLLDTWEEQLSEHVFENRLKWRRHHAKNKIAGLDELRAQHIVLTTYHTVSAEWKGAKDGNNSFLFSFHWKRIILDEAHFIRNARSTMSRAVCALGASSRWAVSGTPVQNRLSDLASLLKFIRATPYDDMKQFEAAISSLWKSGEDEEAVKRLQYLSACLLLRRSKEAIDLPPKQDLLFPVDFLPDERAAYEHLRTQAIYSIDEAVYGHNGSLRHNNHANALRKIEALRLFSDLGLQYHARHEPQADQDWPKIAQQAFNSRRAIEPLVCMHCSLSLDFAESLLDEPNTAAPEPQFSSCMKFVCSDCTRTLNRGRSTVDCGHKPVCAFASVSTGGDAFEEIHDSHSLPISPTRLSSKVEALITDLRSLPPDTKCVVFSTWRLTLDLVKAGLDRNSIQHIRFDGKVPQNERGAVISRFRNDPEIRIMLLTLSCGAVGLTLTVASRAYLMEPHWNPTLEEQALARIHRLGQKQPVTTVRLYMRNSFEEEVIKVQESKKQLANVLLQPHDGGSAGDNLSTLQGLRSLL
ncbi:SNF2 family N-terminal domain-containing protein [Xylaria grammica]|nr:SNF2 family N-terminal domain-containing protein [Xylaria grammica]